MVNTFCYSWRSTYVLDVGQHEYVDRHDLLRYAGTYDDYGFTKNFIWYAPQFDRTFRPETDSGVKWASCANEFGGSANPYPDHERPWLNQGEPTGLCTDRIVRPQHQSKTLLDTFFDQPVTLRVLQYDGAFIALECGNFSVAAQQPVPSISGTKYHDANRNGTRDGGERGLGGWQMRLYRDSSLVGEPTGYTGHHRTTDADGTYAFRLDGLGPGTYHVEEVQQTGFAQTRAPGAVHVPFGAGSTPYGGHDFGNVENTADVVKADWQVVSPPERIDAGVPTALNVRATLENVGPAPEVDVEDTMTLGYAQDDCAVLPRQQAVTRRLRRGEPVHVDFVVTVTCEDPSNHLFVFDNALRVTTPGVTDPDLTDNARSTSVTIPVWDDSDLRLTDGALDCPARTNITETFTCTGTVLLHNDGPYGPTDADVAFSITPPADCTVPAGPGRTARATAPSGTAVPVAVSWDLSCADRSYHPIAMDALVAVTTEHVEDEFTANDATSASDTIEVFEQADLSVVNPVRIACGGRLPSIPSFACDVRATVHNAGPATAVQTATTATLTAPADCVVSPVATTLRRTLDAGERETLAYRFEVTCADRVLHTLLASVTIAADEPHAEDLDAGNDTARVRWVPTDVKPRSEPSSVNVGKEGVVPVAILSTPGFDAFAEVDRESLRWGVTGFEASLVSCGGAAEDTNGDGWADLVCRFDTKVAGITCATREAILTGYLRDGTPLESQDPVNVTGCKK